MNFLNELVVSFCYLRFIYNSKARFRLKSDSHIIFISSTKKAKLAQQSTITTVSY